MTIHTRTPSCGNTMEQAKITPYEETIKCSKEFSAKKDSFLAPLTSLVGQKQEAL